MKPTHPSIQVVLEDELSRLAGGLREVKYQAGRQSPPAVQERLDVRLRHNFLPSDLHILGYDYASMRGPPHHVEFVFTSLQICVYSLNAHALPALSSKHPSLLVEC